MASREQCARVNISRVEISTNCLWDVLKKWTAIDPGVSWPRSSSAWNSSLEEQFWAKNANVDLESNTGRKLGEGPEKQNFDLLYRSLSGKPIRTASFSRKYRSTEELKHWDRNTMDSSTHREVGNERADVAANQATGWRLKKKSRDRTEGTDINWTASSELKIPNMRFAIKTSFNRFIKQEWSKERNENERERALYRVISAPTKQVLKTHKSLTKWISSILVQMRAQKIEVQKSLFTRKISGIDSPECNCKLTQQNVLHILWHCALLHKKRKTMWKDEIKRFDWWFELTHLRTLLNKPLLARKAAIFMADTGLFGQKKA